MYSSPLAHIRTLETQLNAVLSALDVYDLPAPERKLVTLLKHTLSDARLDVRDYEMADTRAEQVRYAKQAHERLEQIRQAILSASEYNIFNAVDVAQYTAQLEQIIDSIT